MEKPDVSGILGTLISIDDEAARTLVEPTEPKTPGDQMTEAEIEAIAEETGGFGPAPEGQPREGEKEAPSPSEEPVKKLSKEMIRMSAESRTLAIDTLIGMGLPFLYKLRSFSMAEFRTITKFQQVFKARLYAEKKGKSVDFEIFRENEALEDLYHAWCEYGEFVKTLEVEESRLQNIVTAWERYIEYTQKLPGPAEHLISAYVAAYGPNITPLIGF